MSLDDIMPGVSVLRNQNLANIFYRLRLIEAYGTGILKSCVVTSDPVMPCCGEVILRSETKADGFAVQD